MEETRQEQAVEFEPQRLFDSFISVSRAIILQPRVFFKALPRQGSLKNPFFFLAICSFLASLFVANIRRADYNLFFILFFANIASIFFESLVLHGLLSRAFKSAVHFSGTFRIIAYAGLTSIVSWIPMVGIFAYCYGLYLIFIGLQEMHELKPRQAGLVIMSIMLIVTILFMGLLIMTPDSINQGIKLLDPQYAGEGL